MLECVQVYPLVQSCASLKVFINLKTNDSTFSSICQLDSALQTNDKMEEKAIPLFQQFKSCWLEKLLKNQCLLKLLVMKNSSPFFEFKGNLTFFFHLFCVLSKTDG